MDAVTQLLALPVSTLIVLGAGYVGYRIAYAGLDGAHGPADTVFLTFAFAAVAKLTMLVVPTSVYCAALAAVAVTITCAIMLRTLLAPGGWWLLRKFGICDHDRGRSAWESMIMRRLKTPTRITVYLKNEQRLMCADLRQFDKAPLGPCVLGPDGSVALYVTDYRKKDCADWTEVQPLAPEFPAFAYRMTIVPAAEIESVEITRPA